MESFITCNPYKNKKITALSHNTAPQTGYKDSGRTFLSEFFTKFPASAPLCFQKSTEPDLSDRCLCSGTW